MKKNTEPKSLTGEEQVVVSVVCNTYNHERYIRKALDGFVMQNTNFKYEVLVHDDASTDSTAEIIREYERMYPEIIKPIYQTINQYSQGIAPGNFQFPRVKGKYIALCEGDDYWIDPCKLQKQFDAMEENPDVDICAHAAEEIDATTGKIIKYIAPCDETCIIPTKDVIQGGGGFVATNSLFYRTNINNNMPEFRKYLPLDYTTQVHGSMRGGMLYLSDCMSVYQFMTINSWTVRVKKSKASHIAHYKRLEKMYFLLNRDTNNVYRLALVKRIIRNRIRILKCWIQNVIDMKR